MPSITLTTDNATASTIATALAQYYDASNGYSDGSGNSLTGSALIKAFLVSQLRHEVRRYNLDQSISNAQTSATNTANGLSIV